MDGKKLGELLGNLVGALENVSLSIDSVVSEINDIDGATIIPEGFEEAVHDNQPHMTVGEFREIINRASNDLSSLGAELEGIAESLQSLSVEN